MQDVISTKTSQTAMACEQAALFGATPGPDEFDNREIWNEDEALAGIEEAIHILAGAVAPDGTQLADERESLLWGFVNALELLSKVDGAVKSRFLMRVGWVIIVHVYFTRPTDRRIV